jgi:hypothetical protein
VSNFYDLTHESSPSVFHPSPVLNKLEIAFCLVATSKELFFLLHANLGVLHIFSLFIIERANGKGSVCLHWLRDSEIALGKGVAIGTFLLYTKLFVLAFSLLDKITHDLFEQKTFHDT